MDYTREEHVASLCMVCRAIGISDSAYRYQPDRPQNDEVIARLREVVARCPAYGFDKQFKILRRWGHVWNHKWVHCLYCELNLNKRRRGRKQLPSRNPELLPAQANHYWSMDFMSKGENVPRFIK